MYKIKNLHSHKDAFGYYNLATAKRLLKILRTQYGNHYKLCDYKRNIIPERQARLLEY